MIMFWTNRLEVEVESALRVPGDAAAMGPTDHTLNTNSQVSRVTCDMCALEEELEKVDFQNTAVIYNRYSHQELIRKWHKKLQVAFLCH